MSYMCFTCQQFIHDHVVMECDRRHFHSQCLKCEVCRALSTDKLYSINGLLVCRQDYLQLKSVCHVCRQTIAQNDYRFETQNKLQIHIKCMNCSHCRQSLERGDKYVIQDDRRLLCQKCCQQYSPRSTPPPSRRGRKRQTNH